MNMIMNRMNSITVITNSQFMIVTMEVITKIRVVITKIILISITKVHHTINLLNMNNISGYETVHRFSSGGDYSQIYFTRGTFTVTLQ